MENNEEMQELLSLISDYMNVQLETKKISDLKWEESRFSPLNLQTNSDKFDHLLLTDFLILYKINALVEANTINASMGNTLKDLLFLKIELNDKIGLLVNKDGHEEELDKLLQECHKVESILSRYHLSINDFSLEKLIQNSLHTDDYDKGSKKKVGGGIMEIYDYSEDKGKQK